MRNQKFNQQTYESTWNNLWSKQLNCHPIPIIPPTPCTPFEKAVFCRGSEGIVPSTCYVQDSDCVDARFEKVTTYQSMKKKGNRINCKHFFCRGIDLQQGENIPWQFLHFAACNVMFTQLWCDPLPTTIQIADTWDTFSDACTRYVKILSYIISHILRKQKTYSVTKLRLGANR